MKNSFQLEKFFISLCCVISFFTAYLFFNTLITWMVNLKKDFLQDIIAVEGVLIGVAIPVSFQLVLSIVKEYDKDIAGFFIKEPLYIAQYVLFLTNISISIVTRAFQIEDKFWLLFLLYWSVNNIFIFAFFILRVHKYVTHTDQVILNKIWKYAANLFEE